MTFDLSEKSGDFVFKPIYIAPLKAPIWVMQHDHQLLLDLRSVSECLGVAWGRWNLMLKSRRNAWKLERGLDRKARETELMPSTLLLRWLNEAQPMLAAHSALAAQRVGLLRKNWREVWPIEVAEVFPDFESVVAAPKTGLPARRRKVDERLVISFARDVAAGASIAAAAKSAGIGLATAKKIVAGTYTHWTDAAREAWGMTFGAQKPAKTHQT